MNHRRKFLKSTLLGGSAALFVPPALWASPQGLLGANDRIRVGLIGCNGMGFTNLSAFMGQPDIEVAALCDVDARVLDRREAEIVEAGRKKPSRYTDYRKLLDQKDIDVVIIGTPDHWHCLQLVHALQSGKCGPCISIATRNWQRSRGSNPGARKSRDVGGVCSGARMSSGATASARSGTSSIKSAGRWWNGLSSARPV